MSASWSRPISSPKSIPGITSGNRKKHGRRRAHGLTDAAGVAAGGLSRLDLPVDAGPSLRRGVAAAVDGDLPALLPPPVLPHPRFAGAPDRAPDAGPPGVVCRQSHLLSRHRGFRVADRRLVHRQEGGRPLAAVRLAGAFATLGV